MGGSDGLNGGEMTGHGADSVTGAGQELDRKLDRIWTESLTES